MDDLSESEKTVLAAISYNIAIGGRENLQARNSLIAKGLIRRVTVWELTPAGRMAAGLGDADEE